jgi:hypothetical protein
VEAADTCDDLENVVLSTLLRWRGNCSDGYELGGGDNDNDRSEEWHLQLWLQSPLASVVAGQLAMARCDDESGRSDRVHYKPDAWREAGMSR